MRRALLVVVVAAVASAAWAQGGAVAPGAKAVVQVGRTWSESEILAIFTGPVRKPVSWGRAVPYVGAAVVVGSLIYGALDWFYEEAKRATGTPLDDWQTPSGGVVGVVMTISCRYVMGGGVYRYGVGVVAYMPGGSVSASNSSGGLCSGGQVPGSGQSVHEFIRSYGGPIYATLLGSCGTCYRVQGMVDRGGSGYWADGADVVGYVPQALVDFLAANPSARDALGSRVVGDYLSDGAPYAPGRGNFPYTYDEPFGPSVGVTLDPAPSKNEWFDNPYADPEGDADGDGWPDWKEVVAGTDPGDASSVPSVDPDPSVDSDGDGYPDWFEVWHGTDPGDAMDYPAAPAPEVEPQRDSDGDGVPDQFDPCPYDRLNVCADGGGEQEEFPDDYAREGTLQGVASDTSSIRSSSERTAAAVEGILDVLEGGGEVTGEVTFPELAEAWAGVLAQLEASLESVRVAAQGKVLFQGVIPQLAVSGGGSCDEISITLLGITRQLGWCDSVFYTLLTTWARSGLALLMLIGFAFASARTVGAL